MGSAEPVGRARPGPSRRLRWRSLLISAAITIAGITATGVPAQSGAVGNHLSLRVSPTGELGVTPTGLFLVVDDIVATGSADAVMGAVQVHNQTGLPQRVRARLRVRGGLAEVLHAEILGGQIQLADGSVQQLTAWSDRGVRVGVGETLQVQVRLWLDRQPARDWESGEGVLQLRSEPTSDAPR